MAATALNWKVILAFGLIGLIAFFVTAAFFRDLLIVILLLLVLVGLAVFAPKFAATGPGIALIFVLIILIAVFGFLFANVGSQVSLSIAQGIGLGG